jgi:hypothetical protein
MAASQKMGDDEYKEIYIELLKLDLLGGNPDKFLHQADQVSRVGQDLARHNNTIQNILSKHGIISEDALRYQNTYDVILLPQNSTLEQLHTDNYLVLWRDLNHLKEEITKINDRKFDSNVRTKLQKITANIEQLTQKMQRQFARGVTEKQAAADILSNVDILHSIVGKNIVKNCIALSDATGELPPAFFEFSGHVCDRFNVLNQKSLIAAPVKPDAQPHYFTVEQWPKERAMTFFLGDEVGCCLATNGPQFQAIVQRRMDDAMLFHVATDKTTGKPVALIWLYLAETSDNKIVLMANFFEVKAKFGQDEYKRKALLHILLQFTEHYLDDNPGISGFYMNKLKYGWNIHDLDCYPVTPLSLNDKLGGPYILGGIPRWCNISSVI